MDRDQVAAAIKKKDIRWVRMEGVNIDGVMLGKRTRSERFFSELEGSPLADVAFALSIGDDYRENFMGPWQEGILGDVLMVPDLHTFTLVPWQDRTAAVMCDFTSVSGVPVAAAPRTVLADQVERLAALGYSAKASIEYECFLYRETAESAAAKGYRDLTPVFATKRCNDALRSSEQQDFLAEMVELMCDYGLPVEEVKAESGAGQIEINLQVAGVMEAADHAARFKLLMKELLRQHGILACFLARPPGVAYGSSSHAHVSLWDADGNPAFHDEALADKQSAVMRHAVAGLLQTAKPFQAFFCPTLNSGKRLVDLAAAPTAVCWGLDNKSVMVRTLTRTPGAARIEHRLAGADSSAHLVLAAILAGMRHGLEERLEPPEPKMFIAWPQFDQTLDIVPKTLREMVRAMEESPLPMKLFDPVFVSAFVASRQWELQKLDEATTDWELNRYFERV